MSTIIVLTIGISFTLFFFWAFYTKRGKRFMGEDWLQDESSDSE